jgi:hypothetical protein
MQMHFKERQMARKTNTDDYKLRHEQGERLVQVRVKAGFDDAADAARAMGVPVPTYQAHENGTRSMRKKAPDYANYFGIDVNFLLRGDISHVTATVIGPVGKGIWIDETNFVHPASAPVPASPEYKSLEQNAFLMQDAARRGLTEYAIGIPYWQMRQALTAGDIVVAERRMNSLVERRLWRVRDLTPQEAIIEPYGAADSDTVRLPAATTRASETSPKITHLVLALWARPQRI